MYLTKTQSGTIFVITNTKKSLLEPCLPSFKEHLQATKKIKLRATYFRQIV